MQKPQCGGCVCKKVRYSVSGPPLRITICHCQWCQQRTGSAFGVEVVFERSQIRFLTDSCSSYRHISDESGRWLDQHFCNTCGSNIGLTLEAVPTLQSIAAGSFDNKDWSALKNTECRHVFVRSSKHWLDIPDNVTQFETHFRS